MAAILFEEEQKFRSNWLWVLVLLCPVLILLYLLFEALTEKAAGNGAASTLPIAILSLMYGLPALFCLIFIKLNTVIEEDKIRFGFNVPTNDLDTIHFSEIKEMAVIRYSFKGYGYRVSRRYGIIHNVSGNKGLLITKNNGRKLLIGTNKPEALQKAIEKTGLVAKP